MTATTQPAKLLGLPLGDFGLFSSVLLALASGFLAFFATLFLSIIGVLFWNVLGHNHVNYADTYRYIAFPTALGVMAFGFVFLAAVWLRRKLSGDSR
ncbi:MAG TPA: hypothetical protein VHX37_01755 [Acidobacteriaceae bacterium]|jgi:hypothetical protein|nr:hypothetical protein [Acidobacteriaceae bacterium]